MAKSKKEQSMTGELVQFQPATEVTVLPPNSGVMGQFLQDTQNMFKARSMRIKALVGKIDETGQRMEGLLRTASERANAAEAKLEDHLRGQGLLPEPGHQDENEE